MILSEKYRVVEEGGGIVLSSFHEVEVKDSEGNGTGEFVTKEKGSKHYFSATSTGRAQCYSRIISSELVEAEELQEVLATVKRCEDQVIAFWEAQD